MGVPINACGRLSGLLLTCVGSHKLEGKPVQQEATSTGDCLLNWNGGSEALDRPVALQVDAFSPGHFHAIRKLLSRRRCRHSVLDYVCSERVTPQAGSRQMRYFFSLKHFVPTSLSVV